MAEAAIAAALAASAGLYGYNRENWMFDIGILQERTYFGQEMKVKQFELYREDIHDLMELTVSKMDVYLVVLVLELLFCMMLFTEGMPKPNLTPEWMHWLFASSSATAVLYLVLSTWLGMHASISAHSWGVKMLTQSVRLPIPTTKQIHAASAKATDFEGKDIAADMLRIPYLQQRDVETEDTMKQKWKSEGLTAAQREQFLGQEAAAAPSDVALAAHIQEFRDKQANWQAYDAYCRVCMAMGTNQILHSMCYYCLGVMLAELLMSGIAAFFCIIVFAYSAFLILRLDLIVARRTLILIGALQIAAPLLTCVCLWGAKVGDHFGDIPRNLENFVPLTFVLNMLWILVVIYLARGVSTNGSANAVALPSKFRSVLYLDVFGWLSDEGSGAAAATGTGTAAGSSSEPSTDQAPSSSPHAVQLRDCRQIKGYLEMQLSKWECEGARGEVQEGLVEELRAKFDAATAELAATHPEEGAAAEPAVEAPTTVWLKLEHYSWNQPMTYWFDPETGEVRWEPPTVWTSDLAYTRNFEISIAILLKRPPVADDKLKTRDGRDITFGDLCVAANTEGLSPQAFFPITVQVPGLESDLDSISMQLDQFDNAVRALPVLRAEQRLRESQENAPTVDPNAVFHPHGPEGEAEFSCIERRAVSSERRPPGDLPWRTFYQGSLTMVFIWAVGTFWSAARVYFDIYIHVRPVPGPALRQLWANSPAYLELELVSDRSWPHTFFNPKGLGCHSTLGPGRIFVAEAHAMHELQLIAGERRSTHHDLSWQPSLRRCLEQVPDFVADGIRGVSIHCQEGTGNETLQDADGRCSAVLLGALGESLLSCQLRGYADASASKVVTRHLYGGPWAAVAAISETASLPSSSGMGSFWAQGQAALVQLGSQAQRAAGLRQDRAEGALVPLLEVSDDIGQQQVEHMVALPDGSGVLTLTPEGLQLRSMDRPQHLQKLQLPQGQGARWAGVCAPGGRELLLVGRRSRSEEYALWRTKLPAWLL